MSRSKRLRTPRCAPFVPTLFGALALLTAPSKGDSPPVESAADQPHATHAVPAPAETHPGPVRYVCPMHPQIVRDAPGHCPICGMTLVPKRLDPEPDSHPVVALSPEIVQSLGVRTAPVERGTLWREVRTVGRVEYDETRIAHVHPRAEGWIQGLRLRAEGEPVTRGQTLAELYAPVILSAQVDFLLALDPQQKGAPQVRADKARNLLRLLDVPEETIREIERTRETTNTIPILAPIDGVVTQLSARDGMYVDKGTEMFTVADLNRVWVLVDVFEHQIDWVHAGDPAEISVPAHPGRTWQGQVDYLYPDLDPKTRTLKVRLVFPNPDGALKPNMFADVTAKGGAKRDALSIPREALIVTGERESVVKSLGEGRFQPVDVVSGMRQGDRVEILSGLSEGDKVAVSGQFLIDSEASLRASFQRMEPPPAAPDAPQDTGPHSQMHHRH